MYYEIVHEMQKRKSAKRNEVSKKNINKLINE